ncbi:AAA family ATPase [Planctopirus hydrillae]|uniref:Anticodon nuclease n=1 Tax=Planctopirus hydrillae TaxID=1841610 RepID=A0A1C3E7Y4_9PLAN|nr:AAA family ATPase [Planctopirus hydrillae]ODA29269.1 anticodon nuclease [Planctopirus hydrillae]
MSKTLTEIAQQLKDANKKVQLIYAFNGTGKTRLSRAFKKLVAPKNEPEEGADQEEPAELAREKILYYNAFTEDLFYWDNDLTLDADPKLKIQPNSFTDWILRDRGQDQNIVATFQRYTHEKLTPTFIEKDKVIDRDGKRVLTKTFPEVQFSFDRGTERTGAIKISRGEESNLIWSVFYTLLEEVISILNEAEPSKRDDNQFDNLQYVFIDDPVSSLDDGHLIEVAVDLASLVKSSESTLKFIITTHSPLFFNVLHNELNNKLDKKQPDGSYKSVYRPKQSNQFRMTRQSDGLFELHEQPSDSPFSYHLFLLSEIRTAIKNGQVRKYHFSFVRNILEKMATFLGYNKWPDLLARSADGQPDALVNRILNLSSHSAHAGEEVAEIEEEDKEKLRSVITYLISTYGFKNTVV